jgi:hypothetical protein
VFYYLVHRASWCLKCELKHVAHVMYLLRNRELCYAWRCFILFLFINWHSGMTQCKFADKMLLLNCCFHLAVHLKLFICITYNFKLVSSCTVFLRPDFFSKNAGFYFESLSTVQLCLQTPCVLRVCVCVWGGGGYSLIRYVYLLHRVLNLVSVVYCPLGNQRVKSGWCHPLHKLRSCALAM